MNLLVVGHGTHDPRDAEVFSDLAAERERVLGVTTRAAFLNGGLPLATALNDLEDFVVLPWFLSQGYFTQVVLPRELPGATLLEPVGVRSIARAFVQASVQDAIARGASKNADVVLVGHGTRRDPRSAETTLTQAQALREAGKTVHAVFLDQDPEIETCLTRLGTTDVVVVPFLLFEGGHTSVDVPRRLGFDLEKARGNGDWRGERRVFYGPALTHHRLARAFLSQFR